MSIHESGENYLEKILVLSQSCEKLRAVDLCTALGFSRPTVSVMPRELREGGFVCTAANGGIALTPEGEAVARRIYDRHQLIAGALMALGVSRETALSDACKMEHDISEETAQKLREFLESRNA